MRRERKRVVGAVSSWTGSKTQTTEARPLKFLEALSRRSTVVSYIIISENFFKLCVDIRFYPLRPSVSAAEILVIYFSISHSLNASVDPKQLGDLLQSGLLRKGSISLSDRFQAYIIGFNRCSFDFSAFILVGICKNQ